MRASLLEILFLSLALVAGCDRVEKVPRVQEVPKQPRPIMAGPAAGQLDWTAPRSWTPIPAGQMRLAAFRVSQKDPSVLMTVIPLAGESGGLLANVNRWEGEVSLPPTSAADLDKVVKRIEVAGKLIDIVDLTSPESASPRLKLLGAILPYDDRTFYFKLKGPEPIVAEQKANFDAFIQSIHFDSSASHAPPASQASMPADSALPEGHPPIPAGAGAAAASAGQSEELAYSAPEGWTKEPPLPLRVVSFHIGEGEGRADVIVSQLPAISTGSYAENVSRWRGQVGLPPLAEGEQQRSSPLIVGGVDSALFDFIGPGDAPHGKRMLLGWVPRGESWWFFKMIGPSDVVGGQQKKFVEFLDSVKFIEPKS